MGLFKRVGASQEGRGEAGRRFLWALRDVSVELGSAEALGIIGRNGSGKSTLLKLLAGVTYPTRGLLEVGGRISPLIEVGAGIHPELTGRENIYFYGAIIGLSRREMLKKFDRIVDFSGIEEFLDLPVKRYSSGMKIRLGFSIVAHVDPDILLVDEVLAVGDGAFQRKCLHKIKSMLDSGTTILYVSHELSSLERLCPTTLWLDHGIMRQLGPSSDVVRAYLSDLDAQLASEVSTRVESPAGLVLEKIDLTDPAGKPKAFLQTGDALTVHIPYRSPAGFTPVQVALKLLDDRMTTVVMAVWENGKTSGTWHVGAGTLRCTFESLPLSPRLYQLWIQVLRHPDYREEVPWTLLSTFPVIDSRSGTNRGDLPLRGREAPIMVASTTWSVGEQRVPSIVRKHSE